MWRLEKELRFEAAHRLLNVPQGHKCGRLHGHSYRAVVVLEGDRLPKLGPQAGMLRDYADIDEAAAPLLRRFLDHHYLNETLGFEDTTSENVARWIYERLKPDLPELVAVRLHETCTASTEYRP